MTPKQEKRFDKLLDDLEAANYHTERSLVADLIELVKEYPFTLTSEVLVEWMLEKDWYAL